MATSKAKKDANKANSKKSTGPKTAQGKSKSKFNATKHGIYATSILLEGESKKLYNAIKNEQNKRYRPRDFIETALVAQLVRELWTLRRIMQAEYYFTLDAQKRLQQGKLSERYSPPLSKEANKVKKYLVEKPNALEIRLGDARKIKYSEENDAQELTKVENDKLALLDGFEELAKRQSMVSEVYLDVFFNVSQGQMQRFTALRRYSLQTILSLERELDRRHS